MLAERGRRVACRKGDMNPLLEDGDSSQAAYANDFGDKAKSLHDEDTTSESERLFVPRHVKIGFFLAGLFNNMSYCIILAGAKEVNSLSSFLRTFTFVIRYVLS